MNKKANWIFSEAYYNKQQTIKEFASATHSDMVSHIHELRIKLNDSQQLIDKQQENQKKIVDKKSTLPDYRQEWSYPTKILFIISTLNRPLTSLEIQEQLKKRDKKFKSIQRTQTTLSSILNRACKTGRIAKFKIKGKTELLFVVPSWISKQGELQEVYLSQVNLF
jgi:hypothetical protein